MNNSKYYWLKLQNDFFKRHDIKIIENMPNGKDYIIFYLKLLCESTTHEGRLRFSDEIPYSDEMLSIITDTNIDIVRSAIKIFEQLKMIDVLDDGTFFLRQVEKMIGSETKSAERVRRFRENQKALQCNTNVAQRNIDIDIDIEKDIDKEIDIDINKKEIIKEKKSKPVKHKYGEYKHVMLSDDEYNKLYQEYPNASELIKKLDEGIELKGYKYNSHYLAIRKWAKNDRDNNQQTTSNPFLQRLMEEENQW